ncbi:unnamed protein product, partial [Dibothriocephalus latus]
MSAFPPKVIEDLDLEIKARDEIIGKLVNKNRSLTLAYGDLWDKYESKEADLSIQLQNIRARVAETTKHLKQASGQSRATKEVVSAVLEGQRRLSQHSNQPSKWNTSCPGCSEVFGFAEAICNAAIVSSHVSDKFAALEGLLAKQKLRKDSSQPPQPSACNSAEVSSVLREVFAIFEPVLESPPVKEMKELEQRLKEAEAEVARLTELTKRLQRDLQESQLSQSRTSVSSFAPSESRRQKGEETLTSESEALIAAKQLELEELRRQDINWDSKVVPLLEMSAEIAAMRKSAATSSAKRVVKEAETVAPPPLTSSTEEDVSQGSSVTYTRTDGPQSLDLAELEARIAEVRADLSNFVRIFSQEE